MLAGSGSSGRAILHIGRDASRPGPVGNRCNYLRCIFTKVRSQLGFYNAAIACSRNLQVRMRVGEEVEKRALGCEGAVYQLSALVAQYA